MQRHLVPPQHARPPRRSTHRTPDTIAPHQTDRTFMTIARLRATRRIRHPSRRDGPWSFNSGRNIRFEKDHRSILGFTMRIGNNYL